ncbi:MAG: CoA transferase [Gammaproteobacteria bacterium]|nr:MAG: CoA transferase [Gammaproteobacteria bacterium]
MGPLAGIKVVEIAGIGPGPCAGMMLADMGAEVTLVERRNPNANAVDISGDSHKQAFYNRGKKSIALDLKNPDAIELVLKLIAEADVFIEGFRPGVMERLGLGPDTCLERNSRLVYSRMTGWGQTGPLSHAAGHDPNYIALTGALWYGGSGDRPPTAPVTLVGDLGGGTMVLLFGILSAVIHAGKTGEGQVIDSAITDGSAYISSLLWMMHNTGQVQDELGKGWPDFGSPWHDTYECADGKYVTVCSLEPQFYAELVERMGLADNPVFANQWDSSQWPEGKAQVKALFLGKTRQEWCDLLEGTDVCFGPALNMSEAPQHPHNVARGTFLDVDGVIQPAPAPKFSRSEPSAGVVPATGEHNDEVLQNLGLDAAAIAQLKSAGAV